MIGAIIMSASEPELRRVFRALSAEGVFFCYINTENTGILEIITNITVFSVGSVMINYWRN